MLWPRCWASARARTPHAEGVHDGSWVPAISCRGPDYKGRLRRRCCRNRRPWRGCAAIMLGGLGGGWWRWLLAATGCCWAGLAGARCANSRLATTSTVRDTLQPYDYELVLVDLRL
eukprot:COSAG01_NODE_3647_length_5829_cov_27.360558_5_plen_116_part_00